MRIPIKLEEAVMTAWLALAPDIDSTRAALLTPSKDQAKLKVSPASVVALPVKACEPELERFIVDALGMARVHVGGAFLVIVQVNSSEPRSFEASTRIVFVPDVRRLESISAVKDEALLNLKSLIK